MTSCAEGETAHSERGPGVRAVHPVSMGQEPVIGEEKSFITGIPQPLFTKQPFCWKSMKSK